MKKPRARRGESCWLKAPSEVGADCHRSGPGRRRLLALPWRGGSELALFLEEIQQAAFDRY
jgi:hypothetical protein